MSRQLPPNYVGLRPWLGAIIPLAIIAVVAIIGFVLTHKPSASQARNYTPPSEHVISSDLTAQTPSATTAPTMRPTPPIPSPSPMNDIGANDMPAANAAPPPPPPAATAPPTESPAQQERERQAQIDRAALEAPLGAAASGSGNTANSGVAPLPSATPSSTNDGYWLRRGMVIRAIAYTSIDSSSREGIVVAYLDEDDLWDYGHRVIVAPRYSKLIGSYNGSGMTSNQGQTHIPAMFDSLQIGDRTLSLGEEPGVDPTGTSGLGASVDRHTGRALKNFLIITAAGVLLGRSSSQSCSGTCAQTGSSGNSVGSSIVQAGQQYFPPNQTQEPTLHVSEGARIDVMLSHDIKVQSWSP